MKNFIQSGFVKGIILGGAVSAAVMFGYAYGQQQAAASQVQQMLDGGQTGAGHCRIRVGEPRMSTYPRCLGNQVMVGMEAARNRVHCAELELVCTPPAPGEGQRDEGE